MKRPEVTYLVNDEQWELTENFYVKRMRGIIEKGFRFDLASIPRLFWRVTAPFELSIEAPLAHDYLYRFQGRYTDITGIRRKLSRKDTDDLFLQIMTDEGVGWFRRNAAYRAVRMFAGGHWK